MIRNRKTQKDRAAALVKMSRAKVPIITDEEVLRKANNYPFPTVGRTTPWSMETLNPKIASHIRRELANEKLEARKRSQG